MFLTIPGLMAVNISSERRGWATRFRGYFKSGEPLMILTRYKQIQADRILMIYINSI